MHQSLKAVRMGGVVSMVGNVGKVAEGALPVTTSDIFSSLATVRCIGVGSKQSFLEMNKVIEASNIKPVLDKTVFDFDDMKAAYQYMVRILQWPPIPADSSRHRKATLEKLSLRLMRIESHEGTDHIYGSSSVSQFDNYNIICFMKSVPSHHREQMVLSGALPLVVVSKSWSCE
jgi:hypothetical protein